MTIIMATQLLCIKFRIIYSPISLNEITDFFLRSKDLMKPDAET